MPRICLFRKEILGLSQTLVVVDGDHHHVLVVASRDNERLTILVHRIQITLQVLTQVGVIHDAHAGRSVRHRVQYRVLEEGCRAFPRRWRDPTTEAMRPSAKINGLLQRWLGV